MPRKINVNEAHLFSLVSELRISPLLARRIIEARETTPFESLRDIQERLELDIASFAAWSPRASVVKLGPDETDSTLDAAIVAYTDHFVEACLAIPLSKAGIRSIQPVGQQLRLAVRGALGAHVRVRTQSEVIATRSLLEESTLYIKLLESTIQLAAVDGLDLRPLYTRILLSDLPADTTSEILGAPNANIDFALYEIGGRIVAPDRLPPATREQQPGGGTTSRGRLRAVLEKVTENKELLAKLLKLGALARPWLKYIAALLEAMNDVIDTSGGTFVGVGGATAKCKASAYLLGVTLGGGDVGDDWELVFNIAGQIATIGSGGYANISETNPLLLRDTWEVGICGQEAPVSVVFTAKEIDPASDDIGTPGSYTFRQICPSYEEHAIQSLVTEDNLTAVMTARVQVIKACED